MLDFIGFESFISFIKSFFLLLFVIIIILDRKQKYEGIIVIFFLLFRSYYYHFLGFFVFVCFKKKALFTFNSFFSISMFDWSLIGQAKESEGGGERADSFDEWQALVFPISFFFVIVFLFSLSFVPSWFIFGKKKFQSSSFHLFKYIFSLLSSYLNIVLLISLFSLFFFYSVVGVDGVDGVVRVVHGSWRLSRLVFVGRSSVVTHSSRVFKELYHRGRRQWQLTYGT